MSPNRDQKIIVAVALSLLIHLLLLLSLSLPVPEIFVARNEIEVLLRQKEIAAISPPEQEERPDRSRFLGLYDSKVEEERVAVRPPIPPSRRRIVTGPGGEELPRKGEGLHYGMKRPLEGEGEEDLSTILPEEFFPNLKIGDKTYLNVERYPKVAYFVRLKNVIRLTWNPHRVIGQYIYSQGISAGQIETQIGMQIDPEGNLRKAFVARSSGLSLYDEEALRAIADSAPFSAPPEELLDRAGVLPILFAFTYYL